MKLRGTVALFLCLLSVVGYAKSPYISIENNSTLIVKVDYVTAGNKHGRFEILPDTIQGMPIVGDGENARVTAIHLSSEDGTLLSSSAVTFQNCSFKQMSLVKSTEIIVEDEKGSVQAKVICKIDSSFG